MDDKLTAVIKSVGMQNRSVLLRPPATVAILWFLLFKELNKSLASCMFLHFLETQTRREMYLVSQTHRSQ